MPDEYKSIEEGVTAEDMSEAEPSRAVRNDALSPAERFFGVDGAPEPEPGSEEEDDERRKRVVPFWLRAIAALAVVAVAVAVALGAFVALNGEPPWYDPNAGDGLVGMSDEDIQALLNAKVEEGMMNITILSPIVFPDGTLQPGEVGFNNLAQNRVDQKLTIELKDTGEVVYESGAIAPGQNISEITLDRELDAGTYAAVATVTGYDRETHEEAGAVNAEVVLEVRR